MKYVICCVLFLVGTLLTAQTKQLSPNAEISILTIGPGKNLYDTFGHTAIHVSDPSRQVNWVFNYGVFDFDTPNFYTKFAQGQLLYKLGVGLYPDFYESYAGEQRWMKAQVLDLNVSQKQAVFDFLMTNAEPENSKYRYDFFYDNCATRPIDVLDASLEQGISLHIDHFDQGKTHRDLIHDYVPWNTWGRLGIDIALGSVIDKKVLPKHYLFLPDYTMAAFAKADLPSSNGTQALIKQTEDRFIPEKEASYTNTFLLSPIFILSVLGLLLIYKTYKDLKSKRRPYLLDKLLFLVTGIIGILLFLLWTATDHSTTAWNYNLLWAFPVNVLAVFAFNKTKHKKWLLPYLKLLIILLALLCTHWAIGVQIFAITLIPVLGALLYRYIYIWKSFERV